VVPIPEQRSLHQSIPSRAHGVAYPKAVLLTEFALVATFNHLDGQPCLTIFCLHNQATDLTLQPPPPSPSVCKYLLVLADIRIQKLGRSVSLFRNSIRVSEKNQHQEREITFKNISRSNYTRCLRKRNSSLPKMGLPLLLDLSASPISLCLALFVWTLSRPSAQNSTDLPPSFAVVDASREQAIGVRGTTTPASISRRLGEGIRPPHDPAQGRAGSTINIPPALKAGW